MKKRKSTRNKPIYKNGPLSHLLFEQEDPFAEEPAEDEAEEEGGDEEAADEEADEEGGDEEGGDEEGGDEEGEEEEEELDVDPEEEVKLSKSIDQDLEALLIDFEAQARKSKGIEQAEEEGVVIENFHLGMLLEQDEVKYEEEIDLDRFTAEVARLIKNYTSLLDMEKMLLNKAREFVLTRYGEEAEQFMLTQLETKHDIEIVSPQEPVDTGLEVPIAVGAGAGAAGGAV